MYDIKLIFGIFMTNQQQSTIEVVLMLQGQAGSYIKTSFQTYDELID